MLIFYTFWLVSDASLACSVLVLTCRQSNLYFVMFIASCIYFILMLVELEIELLLHACLCW